MNSDIDAAFTGACVRLPELKRSRGGKPYCQFALAVGEGESRKFIRVAAFSDTAEKVARDLRVGGRAYVEGSLDVGIWAPEGRAPQVNLNCAARRVEVLGQIGRNRPKPDQPAPDTSHGKPPFDDELPE